MEADVFASSGAPKPGGEKAKSKHSKLKNDKLIKGLQEIEGKLNKLIEENKQLKKDYANEQCRGNQERAEKLGEQNLRQQLEKENHDLKAEISSYKKNGHVKDENEIQLLKDRLLEVEGELERLKKLHSVEKIKLENESKKVSSDKMKAVEALKLVKNEKKKVEDDKKFIEKKAEEYMGCLEKAKFEIKELTEKLKAEVSKTEDFKKKFESEKLKMAEKVRADLHKTFTAEQKRLIDIERKKTNEEKARVEHLTRVSEEEKQIREKLQKKIEDFESTSKRKRGNCNAENIHGTDSSAINENTALLREMCKLLKKQAMHAEKKANPEKIYVVQESQFLQQSLMDLSNRVSLLDARLAHSIEGIDVLTESRIPQGAVGVNKKNNLLDDKMTKHQSKKERRVTKICCSGNAPISELASTEPHKGINNPQTSAICSNTSYSDIRSMGSKERDPHAALPSTDIKLKRPNKRLSSIDLSIDTPRPITENKKMCILANNVEECRSYKENICSSKRQKVQDSWTGEKTSTIKNDNPQQDKRNMQMNMESQFSRSELDDLIIFEKMIGGNCLKLLDMDSSTEEKYRKAVEVPISPTLPCLEVTKHQLQVEGDAQRVMEKDGPLMNKFKSNTSSVVTEHNETLEAVNTTFEIADNAPITRKLHTGDQNMAPTGITLQGDINAPSNISKQPTLCCVVHSDIKDKDNISRIICMRNTFTCQNITTVSQLDHLVVQVHNVMAKNATFTPQEKGSILLSLLICNISSLKSVDLKSTPSKDLLPCFMTSVEINKVIFSADTIALFEEICHLDVLTSLLEDFLIEKRSLVYCDKPYESIDTSSIISQLDGTHILSKPATFDQFIAGCIILASISGAANRVGVLLQTSYKILRMCRTDDASWVLSALHIFSSVNGNNCVAVDEHKFLIVALNSMVRLIESTRVPTTDFSNLSHYKECPFATSALCMEKLATLLLDTLQCFIGCGVKDNNVQTSNYFSVSMVHDGENDVSSGSNLLFTYIKHDDDDISFGFFERAYCHINDVVSLLELVGCYMSLEWTCNNILPCILKILESCATEEYTIVLLNLIGQLGRFGIEANGHKSNGLPKLRDAISIFLDSTNTKKTSLRTQFAAVNSLLSLLPFTVKEIIDKHQNFHPDTDLSNYVKSIECWFSGLSDQNQSLCLDFLDQVNIIGRDFCLK